MHFTITTLQFSQKWTVVEVVCSTNTASRVVCTATLRTEMPSSVSGPIRIAVLMAPTITVLQHERIRLLYDIRDQISGSVCRSGSCDGHVYTVNNNSKNTTGHWARGNDEEEI